MVQRMEAALAELGSTVDPDLVEDVDFVDLAGMRDVLETIKYI
jgi:hypothetical protein